MYKLGVSSKEQQKQPEDDSLWQRIKNKYLDVATGFATGKAVDTLINLDNHYTPQENQLGELFADYATNKLKKDKGYNIKYFNSLPRAQVAENSGIVPTLIGAVTQPRAKAYNQVKVTTSDIIHNSAMKGIATKNTFENLRAEILGKTPPDKLMKNPGNVEIIGNLMNKLVLEDRISPEIASEGIAKELAKGISNSEKSPIDAIFVAPRNNIRAMAHELGHIENDLHDYRNIKSPILKKIKEVGSDVLAGPLENLWNKYAPDSLYNVGESLNNELNKNSITKGMKNIALHLAGSKRSFPAASLGILRGLSVLAPETMKKLEEKDPTGAVKYLDDNAELAMLVASTPQIIMEAKTSIPGTKMVYNFYKDLKDGSSELLRNHPYLNSVSKNVSPTLEAAKFFGKNIFSTVVGPVAATAGAMYLAKKMKEKQEAEKISAFKAVTDTLVEERLKEKLAALL